MIVSERKIHYKEEGPCRFNLSVSDERTYCPKAYLSNILIPNVEMLRAGCKVKYSKKILIRD